MKSFTVFASDNPQQYRTVEFKGGADTYQFDFSPWAEDNTALSGVTWSTETGNAAVSGESLDTNVASALVTFSQAGRQLLKLTASTGTETYVLFLDVLVKDLAIPADDYGHAVYA